VPDHQQPYSDPEAVEFSETDLSSGSLRRTGYARPGKLFTTHQELLQAHAGQLEDEVFTELLEAIIRLLRYGAGN